MRLDHRLALFAGFLFFILSACVSPQPEVGFGVQSSHASYVPARIAILPCQAWPNGARYQGQPLTNVEPEVVRPICDHLDAAVLTAFAAQPFMKGFSPKFVQKTLSERNQNALLAELPTLWAHAAPSSDASMTAPSLYVTDLQDRSPWILWLNRLSTAVRHADAVLLPFVTYLGERRINDRGLLKAERSGGVVLLLVDTNSGRLLWAGGREASVANKLLGGPGALNEVAWPEWQTLEERLYTEDLWHEFPGRQIF